MFRYLLARVDAAIADILRKGFPYGLTPVVSVVGPSGVSLPYDASQILRDFNIVFGIPTSKTPLQKKRTRRYGLTRVHNPKNDLVTCQLCGNWHEPHTICGHCYEKVRNETEEIKLQMLDYNPLVRVDEQKETVVRYKDDPLLEGKFWQGKRIIEIDRERPTKWFVDDLRQRWNKLLPDEKSNEWKYEWDKSKRKQ